MRGLGETSSLTNAGASLEMALKGWRVTATERGRGCGFGAKNCDALATFSLSSRLSRLMALMDNSFDDNLQSIAKDLVYNTKLDLACF